MPYANREGPDYTAHSCLHSSSICFTAAICSVILYGRHKKKLGKGSKTRIQHPSPRNQQFYCSPFQDNMSIVVPHNENMPIQIYWNIYNENFQIKNSDIFHISAQNIGCGYPLEPRRRGGSNEYPQSILWSRNKKNIYTPVNTSFPI